jgi:protein-L-isoaspartate(D-aspartate) O-methyltransferase
MIQRTRPRPRPTGARLPKPATACLVGLGRSPVRGLSPEKRTMTAVTGIGGWQIRACELAEKRTVDGTITDPLWRKAFESTPRHVFVPRFCGVGHVQRAYTLDRRCRPRPTDRVAGQVYSDQFLATQWALRDGRRMITSSASQPTLVARMLHLLDVQDSDRVLEIGTGTGYNTALLCHRIGDTAVTSVDIDPILIAEAQSRLAHIGHRPQITANDGTKSLEQDIPYSRIFSTCASPGVPAKWITQLANGGKIVAPFTVGGALPVLTKTGPDEVSGRLDCEQAWFMPLRPADKPMPDGYLVDLPEPPPEQLQHHGTAEVDPVAFADPDFRLWLCLHLSAETRIIDIVSNDFTRTGVIVHTTLGSGVVVRQSEAILRCWCGAAEISGSAP